MSFCDFSEPVGSALEARAYFLLLRQKKVAKEKATPRAAPGVARSLALLGEPGGWLNSPAAQTTPADCPRPACVAQRLPWGPRNASGLDRHPSFARREESISRLDSGFRRNDVAVGHNSEDGSARIGLPGPLERRRATQALAEKGRGLSEARRAEFRSPRQRRVVQGTGRSPAPTQGSPFLCLLSFGEAKESKTPSRRNPQVQKSPTPAGQARKPVLLLQPPIPTR
jgi:hypothetical protein